MDIDSSGPFHKARRAPFYPLQLPLSPFLVRHYWEGGPNGVTVKNLWVDDSRFMGWWLKWLGWRWLGWRFKVYGLMAQMTGLTMIRLTVKNADVVKCTNIWQVVWKHLWCMTRVVLWLVFISDRSVASSSVHFSYKYQSLLFSFLHFQLK